METQPFNTQSFDDWMKMKKPLNQGFIVLKTQEERCEFCRKHIIPAMTDIISRLISKQMKMPDIEYWT